MTNMHAAAARRKLDTVDTRVSRSGEAALADAQIEATLAVAHEQARTADALEIANLIAYLTAATDDRVAYPVPLEVRKSLQAQIDTRLGLA